MIYPDAHLHCASLIKDKLVFDKDGSLRDAIAQGLFLLKVPEYLDLEPGIKLCREFYLPATDHTNYGGFRQQTDIYFDREHFQTEHLLVDKSRWAGRLPCAVVQMAQVMDAVGQVIFQAALWELGVAEHLWHRISGGAVTGEGTHWFAASHYRPERRLPGCAEHRDTGFVTLLYTRQPGFEAFIGGQWQSIAPVPGCFIVNFGACLEALSGRLPLPARAIEHRVRECPAVPKGEDRFSFATSINPPACGDLYELQPQGELLRLMSVEAFLRRFNQFTWQDRRTIKACEIEHGGQRLVIPADTLLWLDRWQANRDPQVFPRPEVFDPGNILVLQKSGDQSHAFCTSLLARNRYDINSFSMLNTRRNPRKCPGRLFSVQMQGLLLRELYGHYEVSSTGIDLSLRRYCAMPKPARSGVMTVRLKKGGHADDQHP